MGEEGEEGVEQQKSDSERCGGEFASKAENTARRAV